MSNPEASNWIDRGEPAEPKLAKTLHHFLGRDLPLEEAQLQGFASVLMGMAAADASEVQVASYLGHIEEQLGRPRSEAKHRRLTAIALWHIAKAALIRDRAAGLVQAPEEQPPLSEWLRERLLRE